MRVKLLFFASCKDIVGCREIDLEIDEGATVTEMRKEVFARFPGLKGLENTLSVAVNTEYADATTALHDGDEIALIPPVSGGA